MSHFLQSPAWARFQQALGRTVIHREGDGWSYRAIVEPAKLNSRLYVPYGPTFDSADALTSAMAALAEDAKTHSCTFVRCEPMGPVTPEQLGALGLRKTSAVQPEHTWRIDVSRDEDSVLSDMTKTLRNLHRNAQKKGLEVRVSKDVADIAHLTRLLGEVSERTGMRAHDDDYFRQQAETLISQEDAALYLVSFENEVIAAALVYIDTQRMYYAHAAASNQHRNLAAPSVLLTHLITDAVHSTRFEVDLYGVAPDDDATHPWAGFSKFKRSFGGYQVNYLGAWELPILRGRYGLYSTMRSLLSRKK